MKLKSLILSLILFTSVFAWQDSKADLLCNKKWEMALVKINGKEERLSEDKNIRFWMVFEKDGTHKAGSDYGVQKGTWKFSKEKDSIFITSHIGESKGLQFITLSKDSLVLKSIERNEIGIIYLKTFK